MTKPRKKKIQFVICIKNENCQDLEVGKIYRVLIEDSATSENYLRVIDESGEDYLYPENYFIPITLPQAAETALLAISNKSKQPA